jgi:hypothetical protein
MGLLAVLRGCRFPLLLWVGSAFAVGFLFNWLAALLAAVAFSLLVLAVSIVRLVKGHTGKCAFLGGVSTVLRLVDLIS